jgi:hypothetical protein
LPNEWATVLTTDESEVGAGAGFQDFIKDRQDWNRDRHAGLFGSECCHLVADMLASKADRIAAAQASVEQYGKPNTRFGADGPSPFVLIDIVLGPDRKPGGFWMGDFFAPDVGSV